MEIIKHPGKGLPKNSETPKDFLLPEDIIQPMLYTFDLSQLDGKERSQRLYWQDGQVKGGKIFVGKTGAMDYTDFQLSEFFLDLFGSTPLANYHTHPNLNSAGFSDEDAAGFYANPRCGYLYLTIANGGLAALLRTEESSKLPFSSTMKYSKELGRLRFKEGRSLSGLGYAYYTWENPDYETKELGHGSRVNIQLPLNIDRIANGALLTKRT